MKLQRMFCCITGAFIAVGFAASQAGAGTEPEGCDFAIEINALRGGSPTTPFGVTGATKDITSKARIAKGSAPSGTTIETQLKIEAFNGGQYVDQSRQVSLVTLGVGKGGQGDKLRINLSLTDCSSESIDFVATFTGPDDDGDECTASKTINKICKAPR